MDLNPQNFFLERLGKGTDCRVIRLIKESNTIGRAENNDYILQSSYISRNHAEIKIKDSRIFLKDVNSANGTFINELRLKNGELEIKTGDVIGMGCHTSAFSADVDLLPTDSIYFYKICVPDCISIDSDTDSDATDINELCDYLANNPGVGFNTSPVQPTNDAIICLSSDEEVELDQIWVERVSGRANSPVPLSMNTASTSKEQLPMVILPPSARKSIEEAYRKELLATNEVITESTNDTTVDKSGKEFTNCFVRINNLSQDEIKKLKKIDNTPKVEKSPPNRKKENILNVQEELRKLCDEDVSDDSTLDKTAKRRKSNKHDKTPLELNQKTQLKSILTPTSKSVKSNKRVSFSETLFSVREIPKINQADSEDEESKEFYDVPTETVEPIEPIEPIDKILTEVLSWCPSLLDTKKGEENHPKNWNFTPMLQSYESLQQYKNILGSILNMELLCNIRGKYATILNSNKTKWTSFKKIFSAKLSSSLFCIQVTGEIKDNRKNYTIGSLIIVRLTIKHNETKFFGYISEPIDRNNTLKVQCFVDDVNFSLVLTENKVDIFPIMYLRSELKSLMALHQLKETDIMMKVLKPELNKDVAIVDPSRDGILSLNPSQTEICCRIVEDLVNNEDAKVIALQGGPGTGKTKVIAASVMKIIKNTKNCTILICSKSNACINEITVLLISLFIENKINLVRFGNRERISDAVNKVSLNELANQYMKPSNGCNFQQAKNAVIQRAEVVCTTLNSSYDLINEYRKHFDVCFIDEASQFTDADLIIPVQCGFRKLVLIGDSKQLQPNVNAKELKNLNFEISLLERMNNIANSSSNRNPVLTLKIQHRMNPEIFKFPNQHFYENQITTSFLHSPSIAVKPYFVFGLKYDQNMTQDTSSYNTGEIKFCYHLCDALLTIIPPNLSVAIITPYLRQRDELIKYFRKNRVDVYTIDSAQGLESDIVILSVTKTRGVGFLANPQRLNVALTRAKKALYVCGNFNSLRNESVWKALLDDAKHRKCYRDIETD
ncbi:unnamed protein product, partial [Diamesa hyperborea]